MVVSSDLISIMEFNHIHSYAVLFLTIMGVILVFYHTQGEDS